MNMNSDKVLLPNDVRKLLNVDNREIDELCKKTSVTPKKDQSGQIYFSIDEVKKLRNAKSAISGARMEKRESLPVMTKPHSQAVVNGLLDTLNKMETNITTSMTKLIDEKLEGMDDVGGGKIVKAYVPLSEMFGYSTDLRSRTQGRGNYSMFFEKYEQVPKNIQEKVLAAKGN